MPNKKAPSGAFACVSNAEDSRVFVEHVAADLDQALHALGPFGLHVVGVIVVAVPMAATFASPAIAFRAIDFALAHEVALFTSSGKPSQANENWHELRRPEPW